jgi:hypothetical protein
MLATPDSLWNCCSIAFMAEGVDRVLRIVRLEVLGCL